MSGHSRMNAGWLAVVLLVSAISPLLTPSTNLNELDAENTSARFSTEFVEFSSNVTDMNGSNIFIMNQSNNAFMQWAAEDLMHSTNYSLAFEIWDDDGWLTYWNSGENMSWENFTTPDYANSSGVEYGYIDLYEETMTSDTMLADDCYEIVGMLYNLDNGSMVFYADEFFTMNTDWSNCSWNQGGGGTNEYLSAWSNMMSYENTDDVYINWSVASLEKNTTYEITLDVYTHDMATNSTVVAATGSYNMTTTDDMNTTYGDGSFDLGMLQDGCYMAVVMLNNTDDQMFYPLFVQIQFGVTYDCQYNSTEEWITITGWESESDGSGHVNWTVFATSYDLVANTTYQVHWQVWDDDGYMMAEETQNFTIATDGDYDHEFDFSGEEYDICYHVEVELIDLDTWEYFHGDYINLGDCGMDKEWPQGNSSFDVEFALSNSSIDTSTWTCEDAGVGLMNSENATYWDQDHTSADFEPEDYLSWADGVNFTAGTWTGTAEDALGGTWVIVGGMECMDDSGEEFGVFGIYGNSTGADMVLVELPENEHYDTLITIYVDTVDWFDDGDDEYEMSFICGNGDEIPFDWVNDNYTDCPDGADEQWYDNGTSGDFSDDCQNTENWDNPDCMGEPVNWFDCNSEEDNETVWITDVNDGYEDCSNGADEGMHDDDDGPDCVSQTYHVGFSIENMLAELVFTMECTFDEAGSEEILEVADTDGDGEISSDESDEFMDEMDSDDDPMDMENESFTLDGNDMFYSHSTMGLMTNDEGDVVMYGKSFIYYNMTDEDMESQFHTMLAEFEGDDFEDSGDDHEDGQNESGDDDCWTAVIDATDPWTVAHVKWNYGDDTKFTFVDYWSYESCDEPVALEVTYNYSGTIDYCEDGTLPDAAGMCPEDYCSDGTLPDDDGMCPEDYHHEEDGIECSDRHLDLHYDGGTAASMTGTLSWTQTCTLTHNASAELKNDYDWDEDGEINGNESDDLHSDMAEGESIEDILTLNGVELSGAVLTTSHSMDAAGTIVLEWKWHWEITMTAAEVGMATHTLVIEVVGDDEDDDHDHDHDDDDHDHDEMVCYDMSTHAVDASYDNQADCETAGLMWTSADSGPDDGSDECWTIHVTAESPWYVSSFTALPAGAISETSSDDGEYSGEGCGGPDEVTMVFSQEVVQPADNEPECHLYWQLTATNGSWSDGGAEIVTGPNGDGSITLDAGVQYFVGVYCWDEDGDDITTSWTSAALGGMSNTQTNPGWTWGYVSFTPPAGTPDFTVDYEWSSGDYGGEGTVSVSVVGENAGDDDASSDSGGIPGFTGVFAVIALLGALLYTQRRK